MPQSDRRSDRLERLEGEVKERVDSALQELREAIRDRLREGHEETVRQLDDLANKLPVSFFTREDVEPIAEEAGATAYQQGRQEAWDDLLVGLTALDAAGDQAAVLETLVNASRRFSSRAILFLTRSSGAEAWAGRGWDRADLQGLEAGYEGDAWARVSTGRGSARMSSAESAGLASRLDSEVASEAVLLPLVLRDRVAAALYADRLEEDGRLEVAALQMLAFAAAQAIETLAFRDRPVTATLQPLDAADLASGLPLWDTAPAEPEAAEPAAAAEPEPEPELASEEPAELEEPVEPAAAAPEPVAEMGWDAVAEAPVEPEPEPEETPADRPPDGLSWDLAEPEPAAEEIAAADEEPEDAPAVTPETRSTQDLTSHVAAAEERAAAEEPAPDPLSAGEFRLEEPVVEEPVTEEPVAEEPVAEEPVAEEPVAEEPVAEEPVAEEPVAAEPQEEAEPSEEPPAAPAAAADLDPGATQFIDRSQLGPPPGFDVPPAPPPQPPTSPAGIEPDRADETDVTTVGRPRGGALVTPPDDVVGPGWAFARDTVDADATGGDADDASHEEARRLARLLVSEIRLYNEEQVEEGRRNHDVYRRLRDDIDRSRKIYEERVDPQVAGSTDYFNDELVRILAAGDADVLGMDR